MARNEVKKGPKSLFCLFFCVLMPENGKRCEKTGTKQADLWVGDRKQPVMEICSMC